MISHEKALELLKRYNLPEGLYLHSLAVNKFSVELAQNLIKKGKKVNLALVDLASLLHDIGKIKAKEKDEDHALTGANILINENLAELADIVRKHRLDSVLGNDSPLTIEEKIVYYADKVVDQEFLGLEKRADGWKKRYPNVDALLKKVYPKIKEIEKELI